MTGVQDEHLGKAKRLLRQSMTMSATDAPESVVHLAYHAMFHAATAVLLKHRDRAAMTHTGLIGAFGQFVKDRGETARKHGRALNRAEDLRLQADYDVSYQDLIDVAQDIRQEARAFVDFCETIIAE